MRPAFIMLAEWGEGSNVLRKRKGREVAPSTSDIPDLLFFEYAQSATRRSYANYVFDCVRSRKRARHGFRLAGDHTSTCSISGASTSRQNTTPASLALCMDV